LKERGREKERGGRGKREGKGKGKEGIFLLHPRSIDPAYGVLNGLNLPQSAEGRLICRTAWSCSSHSRRQQINAWAAVLAAVVVIDRTAGRSCRR